MFGEGCKVAVLPIPTDHIDTKEKTDEANQKYLQRKIAT